MIYNMTHYDILSTLNIYLSMYVISNQVLCILTEIPIIKINSVNPGID